MISKVKDGYLNKGKNQYDETKSKAHKRNRKYSGENMEAIHRERKTGYGKVLKYQEKVVRNGTTN